MHHIQGQLPVAFVVLNNYTDNNDESIKKEIIDLCLEKLPLYSIPIDVCIVEILPKTQSGKVDYRALEKEAEKLNQ